MPDLFYEYPWRDASLPARTVLRERDCVVRVGTTLPIVGIIAELKGDRAFVEWRDGTADWADQSTLRGAPPWWC